MDWSLPDVPKGYKAVHGFLPNRGMEAGIIVRHRDTGLWVWIGDTVPRDKAIQVLAAAVKIYRGRHVP